MSGRASAVGNGLEEALVCELVAEDLCREATAEENPEGILWMRPEWDPGDGHSYDLVCETRSGARWWCEAKKGRGPGDQGVLKDLGWLIEAFRLREAEGESKPGDRFLLVHDEPGRAAGKWADLREALASTPKEGESWEEWQKSQQNTAVRQWLEKLFERFEGKDREGLALRFVSRLEIRPVRLKNDQRTEHLSGKVGVTESREDGERLFQLLGERWRDAKRSSNGRIRMEDLRDEWNRARLLRRGSWRVEQAIRSLREADLRRWTRIESEPGLHVDRSALLAEVRDRALERPVAVLGDVDVGKTSLLIDLADSMEKESRASAIVLAAKTLASYDGRRMRPELLKGCDPEEVFRKWTASQRRLLVIDGLDERPCEEAFKRAIELIEAALAAGNVGLIVSLRRSDVERLCPRELRPLGFESIEIPAFTEEELEELARRPGSAPLADLLGRSDRVALKKLLRNPRRFSLWAQIARGPGRHDALRDVVHEGALLRRYWEFLEDGSARCAERIAELSFQASTGAVGLAQLDDAEAVRDLQSRGVLQGNDDEVWFASPLLRDYAFVRACAKQDRSALLRWIADHPRDFSGPTLVRLQIQHLAEDERLWGFLRELPRQARPMDHLVREAARALAESLAPDELSGFVEWIDYCGQPWGTEILKSFLGARADQLEQAREASGPAVSRLDLEILDELAGRLGPFASDRCAYYVWKIAEAAPSGESQGLGERFLRCWDRLMPEARDPAGPGGWIPVNLVRAGMSLAEGLGREDRGAWIEDVLRRCGGHDGVRYEIALALPRLADVDGDQAAGLWRWLGEGAMRMAASSRGGDIGDEAWQASEATTALLEKAPGTMTAAICGLMAIRAELEAKRRGDDPGRRLLAGVSRCAEDAWELWADPQHPDRAIDEDALEKLAGAWSDWAEAGKESMLRESLDAFAVSATTAFPWVKLFERTRKVLETLSSPAGGPGEERAKTAKLLMERSLLVLEDPRLVGQPSMWREAGRLLLAMSRAGGFAEKAGKVADLWWREVEDQAPGGARRDALLCAVVQLEESPSEELRARAALAKARLEGRGATARPSRHQVWCGRPTPREIDEALGVNVDHPLYEPLAEMLEEAREAEDRRAGPAIQRLKRIERFLAAKGADLDPAQRREACRTLAEMAFIFVQQWAKASDEAKAWAREALLEAAASDDPATAAPLLGADTRAPSARAVAARGLCRLGFFGSWTEREREALGALASDVCGEVRLAVAGDLGWLRDRDEALVWSLAERFAESESGREGGYILSALVSSLGVVQLRRVDPERTWHLLRRILERRGEWVDSPREPLLEVLAQAVVELAVDDEVAGAGEFLDTCLGGRDATWIARITRIASSVVVASAGENPAPGEWKERAASLLVAGLDRLFAAATPRRDDPRQTELPMVLEEAVAAVQSDLARHLGLLGAATAPEECVHRLRSLPQAIWAALAPPGEPPSFRDPRALLLVHRLASAIALHHPIEAARLLRLGGSGLHPPPPYVMYRFVRDAEHALRLLLGSGERVKGAKPVPEEARKLAEKALLELLDLDAPGARDLYEELRIGRL